MHYHIDTNVVGKEIKSKIVENFASVNSNYKIAIGSAILSNEFEIRCSARSFTLFKNTSSYVEWYACDDNKCIWHEEPKKDKNLNYEVIHDLKGLRIWFHDDIADDLRRIPGVKYVNHYHPNAYFVDLDERYHANAVEAAINTYLLAKSLNISEKEPYSHRIMMEELEKQKEKEKSTHYHIHVKMMGLGGFVLEEITLTRTDHDDAVNEYHKIIHTVKTETTLSLLENKNFSAKFSDGSTVEWFECSLDHAQ